MPTNGSDGDCTQDHIVLRGLIAEWRRKRGSIISIRLCQQHDRFMKAKLISPTSPPTWEISLERFPVIIGRSREARIQALGKGVSDLHCEIVELNGRLLVRDLGSKGGTYVNGVQVDVATLMHDDTLTVSQFSFRVVVERPPSEDLPTRYAGDYLYGPVAADSLTRLLELWQRQTEAFRAKRGQQRPQADTMIPASPHPEHVEYMLVQEMKRANIDPAVIHAFEQTGILVTELNQHTLSEQQLALWQEAIDEYRNPDPTDEEVRYPVGLVTNYGPNHTMTSMVVAAILLSEDSKPLKKKWIGSKVWTNHRVGNQIGEFFESHDVQTVISVGGNIGCLHEEGVDYPSGEECPFCHFWTGRQNLGP